MEQKTFLRFPEGFYWGAATSAHQTEGGIRNDWTEWEMANANRLALEAEKKFRSAVPDWELVKGEAANPSNYVSGRGVDHYNRFRQDLRLVKELGLNAYRFSVEWARVEPAPGRFDSSEIERYREMAWACRDIGIEPFVTLWHRTNPLWIRDAGEWEKSRTVEHYLRYVRTVAGALGRYVRFWLPLNEPVWHAACGYAAGIYPPQKKSLLRAERVYRNFVKAFAGAARLIRELAPGSTISTADAAIFLQAYRDKLFNRLTCGLGNYLVNTRFVRAVLPYADFLGVQYYNRHLLDVDLPRLTVTEKGDAPEQSDLGWEIYPEGLYLFLKMMARHGKPLFVTENGVADTQDALRENFIRRHLVQVHRAISEGIEVGGYFHWSLLDNFEWDKGFWPKFGLVEVNRQTMERTIRPSAQAYGRIAKDNGVIA